MYGSKRSVLADTRPVKVNLRVDDAVSQKTATLCSAYVSLPVNSNITENIKLGLSLNPLRPVA